MKNEDNTQKEQMEGAREAMYVTDHNTIRRQETIRHNKSESYWTKYWEAGSKESTWNVDQRFQECRNHQKCVEAHKDVRRSGNQVAEFGFKYFCLDYVCKNGMSVTECNSIPPSRTLSWGPIEFHGKFGLRLKFGHHWYKVGVVRGKHISSLFCNVHTSREV